MTLRRAETITTHDIHVARKPGLVSCSLTCDCGKIPVRIDTDGRRENEALDKLANALYAEHKRLALIRDGQKCVMCDSRWMLETDHIIARGQSGSHSVGNLRTLCHVCHEKRHAHPSLYSPESLRRNREV